MIKKVFLVFIVLFQIFFVVNTSFGKKISQDEYRQMQTHVYKSISRRNLLNSVIRTLTDSDFTIEEYNPDFGFLVARKVYKQHYVNKGRLALNSLYLGAVTAYTVFSYGSTAGSMYDPSKKIANELKDKTVVVDVNVTIEQFGKNSVKVRFVPVKKILQNADGYSFTKPATLRVIRLYDKNLYSEFFKQVENGVKCNI